MFFINIKLQNIVLHHMFNFEWNADVVWNMDLNILLWQPYVAICNWNVALSSISCISFQTMAPSSIPGWSILNTLMVCLQIMRLLATGQSHCVYSQSGHLMVHIFKRLFIEPTYATSLSIREDDTVMYVVGSHNCRCYNTLLFFVAYKSVCFALDTVPIMSLNVTHQMINKPIHTPTHKPIFGRV